MTQAPNEGRGNPEQRDDEAVEECYRVSKTLVWLMGIVCHVLAESIRLAFSETLNAPGQTGFRRTLFFATDLRGFLQIGGEQLLFSSACANPVASRALDEEITESELVVNEDYKVKIPTLSQRTREGWGNRNFYDYLLFEITKFTVLTWLPLTVTGFSQVLGSVKTGR